VLRLFLASGGGVVVTVTLVTVITVSCCLVYIASDPIGSEDKEQKPPARCGVGCVCLKKSEKLMENSHILLPIMGLLLLPIILIRALKIFN
jgi:hypothetical protein